MGARSAGVAVPALRVSVDLANTSFQNTGMMNGNDIETGEVITTPPAEAVVVPTADVSFKARKKTDISAGSQGRMVDISAEDEPTDQSGTPAGSGGASSTPATLGITDTRSVRARRWSALETITVRDFKATKVATIPLDRVTILVGPNGCGKSSVLQAIHWAARAASYVLPKNTKEMISFERLDYVPSSEPLTTLHKGELKSDA